MCCRSFVDCARHRRRFRVPGLGRSLGSLSFEGSGLSGLSQRLGVDDVFKEIQWSGSGGSCCN